MLSRPTLVSKPLIPHLPILYLLPLPLLHRPLLMAFLLRLLPPLLPLTLSGFFNGMLEVFEPGALNYSGFFRPIQSTLSAFRNPILTPLPLSEHLNSLLCVLIAPTPGLAFSLLIPRTLAVSERRKAFAAAHRSDEDRQAYISASRSASSVIAKAKVEAWQTTCSSLSPKSNPKSVHSLLRSIAGSSSSSSSSPNFPNCSSPRESVSVYAAYLRSHFSISQPKALRSRARGYFLSSAKPRALWSLTCSFALLSLSLYILRLPPTFPRPSPLAQIKLPIPC